jgi:hypothetical protein
MNDDEVESARSYAYGKKAGKRMKIKCEKLVMQFFIVFVMNENYQGIFVLFII